MKNLDSELNFFISHQNELYKKYPNEFLVIKDSNICFNGNTFEDALNWAVEEAKFELGSFIIQECSPGEDAYTQTFHSRVIFV